MLYIAHFMLAKLNGSEPMGYDEYLAGVLSGVGETKKPRTPSQIEADFDAIVAADKAKKGA